MQSGRSYDLCSSSKIKHVLLCFILVLIFLLPFDTAHADAPVWYWPVGDYTSSKKNSGGDLVVSTFGYRENYNKFHTGIDISAPKGTPVYAAASGKVIRAKDESDRYGLSVILDHGNGYYTMYAHLSKISVAYGSNVERAMKIGEVGNTGDTNYKNHLHFGIYSSMNWYSDETRPRVNTSGAINSTPKYVNDREMKKEDFFDGSKANNTFHQAEGWSQRYTTVKCTDHIYNNSGYCTNCNADYMDVAANLSPICNKLVTKQDTPVRNRPYAEGSTILSTIPSGQTIYSTGRLDNHWAGHLWYQVTYNGVSGYIYKDNITVADTKSTFLLNFNSNGGSGAPESITAFCAEKTKLPATEPTKSGAAFRGWATNPNTFLPQFKSGETYSIFAKANEQITLYAVWSNSFGATTINASPTPNGSPTAHVCTYGADGFCTVCDQEYPCAVTTMNSVCQTVKEGVPIWSRPYSATSARMDQAEGVVIAKGEQLNIDAAVVNYLGNTWYRIANGRFKGFYLYSENVTLSKTASNTPAPAPTIPPTLTPSPASAETQITLLFHANGGSGGPGTFSFSAGNGFVIPADQPVRSGYRFIGWAEVPDASASSDAIIYGGSVITAMSSFTLYAVWEPDETGAAPTGSATPSTPEPTPYVSSSLNGVTIHLDVPYLIAGDSRWSNLKLGSSSYTVGKSGGLITCMAMYESYRLGTEDTPATLIDSGRAKFSNDGGLLFACDLYKPYKSAVFSMQTIFDLLSSDKPVIVWVNNGGKHYAVLCYAFDGDPSNMELSNFWINDPLNGTSLLSDWSDFSRICYYP